MALVPPSIGTDIEINMRGFGLNGLQISSMAQGIGNAIGLWALTPGMIQVVGATIGTGGAGTVLGKLVVPPAPAAGAIMAGAGAVGPVAAMIGNCVSLGVSSSFSAMAQYTGPSVGVGVGTDVSKVVYAEVGTLITNLMNFPPAFFAGMPTGAQKPFCTGIGLIVEVQLAMSGGAGAVAGPPSPSAATGISNSVIF
jgi:hypothetical protein